MSLLQMKHICKSFSGVYANEDINLTVEKGEIHALLGENGAGKTTLVNIIFGLYTADSGEILWKDKPADFASPREAIDAGIGMVQQHFSLVNKMTVLDNIVLNLKDNSFFLDRAAAKKKLTDLAEKYGLYVNPDAVISDLSVGEQQRVEILKTLHRGADVLILDEPTAVLTPQETDELFKVIRGIVENKGMTVIIITHKLYEVMAISDRVGVMRAGRLVGVHNTCDVNERSLASMMVGREMLFEGLERSGECGEEKIRVEKLQVLSERMLPAVRNVSLSVRAGEILGIAAIEGNGQSELIEAITGLRPIRGGRVLIENTDIAGKTPGQIRALGLAHIPEDRLATGISGPASVEDNLLAGRQREREFALFGIHQKKRAIRAYAKKLFQKFDIRGAGVETAAGSLSGGNMQKVVLAREFSLGADKLIIAQPTRGVDIGAIEFIHNQILKMRDASTAVLIISSELSEVTGLSDRVLVMYHGEIVGSFRSDDVSFNELGLYMSGVKRMSSEELSEE